MGRPCGAHRVGRRVTTAARAVASSSSARRGAPRGGTAGASSAQCADPRATAGTERIPAIRIDLDRRWTIWVGPQDNGKTLWYRVLDNSVKKVTALQSYHRESATIDDLVPRVTRKFHQQTQHLMLAAARLLRYWSTAANEKTFADVNAFHVSGRGNAQRRADNAAGRHIMATSVDNEVNTDLPRPDRHLGIAPGGFRPSPLFPAKAFRAMGHKVIPPDGIDGLPDNTVELVVVASARWMEHGETRVRAGWLVAPEGTSVFCVKAIARPRRQRGLRRLADPDMDGFVVVRLRACLAAAQACIIPNEKCIMGFQAMIAAGNRLFVAGTRREFIPFSRVRPDLAWACFGVPSRWRGVLRDGFPLSYLSGWTSDSKSFSKRAVIYRDDPSRKTRVPVQGAGLPVHLPSDAIDVPAASGRAPHRIHDSTRPS